MMNRVMWAISLTLLLSACSDPCEDYCETFVDRAAECDLGGPSGDDFIDQCSDEVSAAFTEDTCETADEQIATMSCDDFRATVCSQPDANTAYNCQ